MKHQLTVVIPAYNELDNFKTDCLNQVVDYLKQKKLDWQVIVVDDGSTDGSNLEIKKWIKDKTSWTFIQNPHQGKAATVMAGVLAATKPYTLFTDFDQATPIAEIEKLLPFIDKGYKVVVGSREIKGSLRKRALVSPPDG